MFLYVKFFAFKIFTREYFRQIYEHHVSITRNVWKILWYTFSTTFAILQGDPNTFTFILFGHFYAFIHYVMYLYVIFFYVLLQGLQFTLKILSFSKFNFRQNFYFTKLRKFHVINVKKDIITFQSQFEMICCKLCRISSAMVVTYVTC